MKRMLFIALAALLSVDASLHAQMPTHIVVMTVDDPDNYDAVNSMTDFAEKDLRPLGYRVTLVAGDKPEKHHFAGLIEAMKDADLLIVFSRRRFPPKNELAAVRAHLNSGKPLLGIRTANHAFIPKPKESIADPDLTPWPEFTQEVLGGQNAGYETKGLPYHVAAAPGAESSPLLQGVQAENILGHQSLYKVLPLAVDAVPLLIGTAGTVTTPPQPIAWLRTYGANKARVFYTSLGAQEDMRSRDVRKLLLNAVQWTLAR